MTIPEGWQSLKIGDIGDVVSGGTPSTKDPANFNGDIPWITPADLTGYTKISISKGRKSLTQKGYSSSSAKIIPAGSILFSSRAPIGYVAISENEVTTNQGFKTLIPKQEIDPKYVYYYLKSAKHLAEQFASGTTFKELSGSSFKKLPIPVPPRTVQEKIVAKIEELFSEIDNAISLKNKAIKQLELWYESSLNTACSGKRQDLFTSSSISYGQLLTSRRDSFDGKGKYKDPVPVNPSKVFDIPPRWTWCTIDSLAFVTKLAGFEYTKYVKYDPSGDLPVIKAENAGKKGFKKTEYSKVKSESVSMLTRSQINGGDLLMVFVGAGTSNVARVPSDQKYFLGPNIAMMRVLSPHVIPEYLELYLRSPLGHRLAMSFAKAVAQPSLSMGAIRAIPVALPPKEEQEKIVQYLEQVETEYNAVSKEIKASIKLAENIKQSILSKAFKGELA